MGSQKPTVELPESQRRWIRHSQDVAWASTAGWVLLLVGLDFVVRATVVDYAQWLVRIAVLTALSVLTTFVTMRYMTAAGIRQARAEATQQRTLAFMAEAGAKLGSTLNVDDTLAQLAQLAVPMLADVCCIRTFGGDDLPARVCVTHFETEKGYQLQQPLESDAIDPTAAEIVREVLKSGKARRFIGSVPHQAEDTNLTPYITAARAFDAHETILVPLVGGGRALGIITLLLTRRDRTYGDTDLRLADDLGARGALAVDNASLHYRAQHQATHDALTNLPNRVFFQQQLGEAIRMSSAYAPGAVCVLDLDGFKDVNDSFGHQTGDAFLQEVAVRLRQSVPKATIVARLGGDEFAILLPNTQHADIARLTHAIVNGLSERECNIEGHPLTLRGSLGVSLFPAHGNDAATLLRHADAAMYAAKRAASGVAFYRPELAQQAQGDQALLSAA